MHTLVAIVGCTSLCTVAQQCTYVSSAAANNQIELRIVRVGYMSFWSLQTHKTSQISHRCASLTNRADCAVAQMSQKVCLPHSTTTPVVN